MASQRVEPVTANTRNFLAYSKGRCAVLPIPSEARLIIFNTELFKAVCRTDPCAVPLTLLLTSRQLSAVVSPQSFLFQCF